MTRSLSSRGKVSKWPGTPRDVEGGRGGERTRLIPPEGRTLTGNLSHHRYMSTSESEHDILIEEVSKTPLFQINILLVYYS